jgi:hypothetical protein
MTTDNFCFYLQNRLIQTSQTGGQWYSDTSRFSIPWTKLNKNRQRQATTFLSVVVSASNRTVSLPHPTRFLTLRNVTAKLSAAADIFEVEILFYFIHFLLDKKRRSSPPAAALTPSIELSSRAEHGDNV